MKIYSLRDIPSSVLSCVGGKAKGLNKLMNYGVLVPGGFVITDTDDINYDEIVKFYEKENLGTVAVRSSASNEDGAEYSFAGQYETILNVSGSENLKSAVKKCLESLKNITASNYSNTFSNLNAKMNIVVQTMVTSKYAGVSFSIDPIKKNDNFVIESVSGLGEALVSGQANSHHYEVTIEGKITNYSAGCLSEKQVLDIFKESKRIRDLEKCEMDFEWAIGEDNKVYFLQMRPITSTNEAEIDEFDPKNYDDETVFTTCNVGEMLPGAVTPLSLSTSVAAIEEGLMEMLYMSGTNKRGSLKRGDCLPSFSNHLFFNLTSLYNIAYSVLGASKPDIEMSICGEQLDTKMPHGKHRNIIRKAINGGNYFSFMFSYKRAMRRAVKLTKSIMFKDTTDAEDLYNQINKHLPKMYKVTLYHYVTSSHSGSMNGILNRVLAEQFGNNQNKTKGYISGLLQGIDDIESVDILRSMRRLAKECLIENEECKKYSNDELKAFVLTSDGKIKEYYDYFMNRHGHRAIREAELSSESYKQNLDKFFDNLRVVVSSGANEPTKQENLYPQFLADILEGKNYFGKKMLKWLIGSVRAGVRNREFTKSYFIKSIDPFKYAYINLADMLVKNKTIPDRELIYFFTHQELKQIIDDLKNNSGLIKRAMKRRRLFEEQKELRYNKFYVGKVEPMVESQAVIGADGAIVGIPISRGKVKGIARVVRSVDDANKLKQGDIMVAAFTDIGWSPYYSVISGLITEVGSALSHGAVVAREYGLPVVAGVTGALNSIKNGDEIILDGASGTVLIVN